MLAVPFSGRLLRGWLSLATVATLLCGLIAVVAQQTLRLSADDPQIELAVDAAASRTAALAAVHRSARVDIATGLAPWLALYTARAEPLAVSGRLDGAPPRPPAGVFEFARARRERHHVTWQPRAGVRSALVITHTPSGEFVVAGRSLRETERREDTLRTLVVAAWLLALLACIPAAATFTAPCT